METNLDKLLAKARYLSHKMDENCWELGELIYHIYDYHKLSGGKNLTRKAMFAKWGGFAEYCEKELGMKVRTAQNLRNVYYHFAIKLSLSPSKIQTFRALGRSKLYQLATVVEKDTIDHWYTFAKDSTFDSLKTKIERHKNPSRKTEDRAVIHFQTGPDGKEAYTLAVALAMETSGCKDAGEAMQMICEAYILSLKNG